jgi:hypothetical protein
MIRTVGVVTFIQKIWGATEHRIENYFMNGGYLHGNRECDPDSNFAIPLRFVMFTNPPAMEEDI